MEATKLKGDDFRELPFFFAHLLDFCLVDKRNA